MTSLPFFSMGRETYQVPVKMFAENRRKVVNQIKEKAGLSDGILFLEGGPSETRFDSDHEPLFRQESYFWYLSGVKEPDCSLAINVATEETTIFVPRLPPEYATIMGRIRTCDEWKELYQVDRVLYTGEVEEHLLELLKVGKEPLGSENGTLTNGHIKNGSTITNGHHPHPAVGSSSNGGGGGVKILLLHGLNSDSGNMYPAPTCITEDPKLSPHVDLESLFPVLAECRVQKSESELALLQHVTQVTSFAHAYVMRNLKVGMMEYQAESLFRHYCYYNYGCRLVGYTPICGCGPSAAVLHYGHAGEPNARQSQQNDIALFDMGAEYMGYGSDVTCSFPVKGTFTDQHRPIYMAVLKAQIAVYDMIKPGVSWVDCHKAAEAEIIKALIDLGMVVPGDKTVEYLVENRLGAVFMPHGLGHLIGIDTHDVGGYLPGHPERIQEPGLKSLRTARILQENMTLTVEPGCYFIDHLLDEALGESSPLAQYLNADKVQEYRNFGGVRLEDVVCVQQDGCVNYTLCPRTMEEIESVMAGGKWPPIRDTAPQLRRVHLTDPSPLPSPPSN